MGNYGKPGQKPWETMEQYWLNLDENKLRLFQICGTCGERDDPNHLWLWSLNNREKDDEHHLSSSDQGFNICQLWQYQTMIKTTHGHQIVRGKSHFLNYEMQWEAVSFPVFSFKFQDKPRLWRRGCKMVWCRSFDHFRPQSRQICLDTWIQKDSHLPRSDATRTSRFAPSHFCWKTNTWEKKTVVSWLFVALYVVCSDDKL